MFDGAQFDGAPIWDMEFCDEVGEHAGAGGVPVLREWVELVLAHGGGLRREHAAARRRGSARRRCARPHRVPLVGLQRRHIPGVADVARSLR